MDPVSPAGPLLTGRNGGTDMPNNKQPKIRPRDKVRAVVPKLVQVMDDVVYNDIWERPQLSKRDRSLITVAALMALDSRDSLKRHMVRAKENGVTDEEIGELVTHLAFYAGFPAAMAAAALAVEVVAAETSGQAR